MVPVSNLPPHQRLFSDLIETLPDPSVIIDTEGKIVACNSATLESVKAESTEFLLGRDVFQVFNNEDSPLTRNYLEQALVEGRLIVDYSYSAQNGPRLGKLYVNLIKEDDLPTYVMAVFRDVTELTKQRELVREEKNERDVYLGIVAHDLKNYHLTAKTYISLLERRVSLEPPATTFVRGVRQALGQSTILLDNISVLLDRLEGGKFSPVNVLQSLEQVKGQAQELTSQKEVSFDFNVPENLYIQADSTFELMLLNLFVSGIKNSDSKEVVVAVTSELVGDQKCQLRIQQPGPAIPEDRRESYFTLFIDSKKEGKGTGLGLYVTQHLVKRYGGKVWVEDQGGPEPTKGSVFVVELTNVDLRSLTGS